MTNPKTVYSNHTVDLANLPKLVDIVLNPLDEKYPTIEVIRTLISQLILLAVFSEIIIFANLPNQLWLLIICEVVLAFFFSYFGAKRCRYAIREHDIIYQKGLWQQKTTAVSYNRIQHIDISSDPLERRYNTATIKLFTAGGSSADLSISGLPLDIAQSIRQQVLSKLSEKEEKAQHQTHTDEKKNITSTTPDLFNQLPDEQQQTQQHVQHQPHTEEKQNIIEVEPEKSQSHKGKADEQ